MIFGILKSPVKKPENIILNNDVSFAGDTSPDKAATAYHQWLKEKKYEKQEEYQKIILHLCRCYEENRDLGRALYYMALYQYYYPETNKDYLKTYRSILLSNALKVFRENKNKLKVLVIEPELNRLDFLALSLISEVGDFRRFRNAGAFMAYLGLTPSEYSSGNKRKQGSITKAGNSHIRKLLIEASWHYRYRAAPSKRLMEQDTVTASPPP